MSVEIVGRACVTPGAANVSELFSLLRERRCAITTVPRERWDQARYWHPVVGTPGKTYTFAAGIVDDIHAFDPTVFGMSQREAAFLDPQQRLVLDLSWRALEDANIDPGTLRGESIGVYVGASSLDHANLMIEDPAAAGPYFMSGNTLSVVSNRVSHIFGLSGPSMTVDTACSSSLVALDQAFKALEAGTIDTAIVGGVSVLSHPLPFVGFAQARMLSPQGLCRAYDNDGAGYVRSEGGAVLILRRSDKAQREKDRSYATIVASGSNAAGRTNGISLPSREAQAALLRSVYDGNGIDVSKLAFVEGHGTGTKVGDPAEIWSIGTVIGQNRRGPIAIGSIKTNIGHTEPASGVLGLMKAMLSLENDYFPASLHFDTPNEDIDFDGLNVHVASEGIELLRSRQPRFAGVNSFGFGGANAHVVISDPQLPKPDAESAQQGSSFVISAQSRESLERLATSYAEALDQVESVQQRAVVRAAGANRPLLKHSLAIPSQEPKEVVAAIDSFLAGNKQGSFAVGEAVRHDSEVAFVFSGNGSQWAGMAVDAYRSNPNFRRQFRAIDALFQLHADLNLAELLFDERLDALLADTKIAQPLLFAVQAAMADTLIAMGLKPAVVFGHSVGEVAAAYTSGSISMLDAVMIIARRSFYQDKMAGRGKMAAAMMTADEALSFAEKHGLSNVVIAAYNAANSVTVSGPTDEIVAFSDAARRAKRPATILNIDYPFHHPMIDEVRDAFLQDVPDLSLNPVRIPFVSTVTGELVRGEELDASYWWRNLREPVAFHAGAQTVVKMGVGVMVEIGPRPVLKAYLADAIKESGQPGAVLQTLDKNAPSNDPADPIKAAFSRALVHGASFDRRRVLGERFAAVDLPVLPFDRISIQEPRTSDAIDIYGRDAAVRYQLAGWRVDPNGTAWKNHIDAHLFPDLAEHVVDGKAILPGSGFLDIAVSVARAYLKTETVEISNFEIVRPLELSDKKITELSTVISPETGDIEIRSRERLSEDDWTLHALGRCRAVKSSESQSVRKSSLTFSGEPVNRRRAYEIASHFGLEYGPKFQLLSDARVADDDERRLRVTLDRPAPNANPFVTYAIHPISVDATFHGLVAMFDRLTGETGGAPYIPVRFGRTEILRSSGFVRTAEIEIERFSPYSLKARIVLFDDAGQAIAVMDDCRFRRSYLRQHKSLDQVSYHYARIPALSGSAEVAPDLYSVIRDQLPPDGTADNDTLLIRAATLRAAYDLAREVASENRVEWRSLAIEDETLKAFLTHCLQSLAQTGLATVDDNGWTLSETCALPDFTDLFREIYREAPGRVAEIVAVNDSYHAARDRIATSKKRGGTTPPSIISDAMRNYLAFDAPSARHRHALVLDAVRASTAKVIEQSGRGPIIVEIAPVSATLCQRIAHCVAAHGGRYVVSGDDETMLDTLKLSMDGNAHVDIVPLSELKDGINCDLIVSASAGLYDLLDQAQGLRTTLSAWCRGGATLAGAFPASDTVLDFVFGLDQAYLQTPRSPKTSVGRFIGAKAWTQMLKDIGIEGSADLQENAFGDVVRVTGRAQATNAENPEAIMAARPILLVADAADAEGDIARQVERADLFVAGSSSRERQSLARDIVNRAIATGAPVVFLPNAEDSSDALQINVNLLSDLAEAWSRRSDDTEDAVQPRLLVIARSGAPCAAFNATVDHQPGLGSSAAYGLWSFLRVLGNEYPFIAVDSIDLAGESGNVLDRAIQLASVRSSNREWAVEQNSGRLEEIRAVGGSGTQARMKTVDFEAATIRQKTASQLSSIVWEATTRPSVGADDVLIEVAATGLNFRDVMWGMGLLPEEALEDGFAGATIGMECSGRVVDKGENVTHLNIGDAVMAFAPAAFSTHVAVDAQAVARLPERMDVRAGATVPVTFLTAYYALSELGRLREGETVLVHGGAGGVGLAALQIAKHLGATVIATAGTPEKRLFLETLGVDHVFDSRSLQFEQDVRALTGGKGVDVVLNSLFGEAMERSLGLLKPFGRFLELGKRDYYADSKIGLRPFRRNLSYFGIDADQLLSAEDGTMARLLADLVDMFDREILTPLPYRLFGHDEIESAFRLMQSSGHIGKIIVSPPTPGSDAVERPARERMRVDPEGLHLVVGGIGGFGLAAAEWLVERGARKIALSTRRGKVDAETSTAIEKWAEKGVAAHVFACDVTVEDDLASLMSQLRAIAPIRTVVHAAMVLDDALIANLTPERNRPVIDVKARGAALLDKLTREDQLDHFIMFSSATTLIGNPGQANYVAANGFLEGLARQRRAAGLPALAVGFGAISDVGVLANNAGVGDLLAQRIGNASMRARDALAYVGDYIANDTGHTDAAVVMIAEVDWATVRSLPIANTALVETILRSRKGQSMSSDVETIDLAKMIEGKSQEEADTLLYELVAEEVAGVLRVPLSSISRDKVLKDIGLDSLMAIELGLNFQQKTGFEMPLNGVSDTTTIGDISRKLYLRIAKSDSAAEEEQGGGDQTLMDGLVERHRA